MKKDAIRCYVQCFCICSMIPVSKIKKIKKNLKRNEKKMLLDAMPNAFVFVA